MATFFIFVVLSLMKKRQYQSSELVKTFAKKFGFEEKLLALQIKDFLEDYLDDALFREISQVDLKSQHLTIRVKSPLLKHDFRMKKNFFLDKFKTIIGEEQIKDLSFL